MKWQYESRKDDSSKRYCWNRMDITWKWFSKDEGKGQRQRRRWRSSSVFKPDDWKNGGAFSEISGPQSTASHCPPHEAWDRFAGVTDDRSRFSRHFCIFILDSSALNASFLKLFPWFSISALSQGFYLSVLFAQSSLLPYPPLCGLYGLEFLKAGTQPHFSPNSMFPIVFTHYQCFKNLCWLIIPKFEFPADTSPWGSRPKNPPAFFTSPLWYR